MAERLKPGTSIEMLWKGKLSGDRYRVLADHTFAFPKEVGYDPKRDYILLNVNEWRIGWERQEVVENPTRFIVYNEQ